jgi:hypothetical protein
VLCAGYDDCLDAALHQSWRSWTCARCALFEVERQLRAAERSHLIPIRPMAPFTRAPSLPSAR